MGIKRVYHHYMHWEDWKAGQYRMTNGIEDEALIQKAAELLRDTVQLKLAMRFCALNWKHAAAENLSNPSRNKQAWLGQAACCYVHGTPEQLTKLAWHRLTQSEQDEANAIADLIFAEWEANHAREELERCQRSLFPLMY